MRVYTKSSRPRVELVDDGSYRVYVSSAPEKGHANKDLLVSLSRYLGVARSEMSIVKGKKSRDKLILIRKSK